MRISMRMNRQWRSYVCCSKRAEQNKQWSGMSDDYFLWLLFIVNSKWISQMVASKGRINKAVRGDLCCSLDLCCAIASRSIRCSHCSHRGLCSLSPMSVCCAWQITKIHVPRVETESLWSLEEWTDWFAFMHADSCNAKSFYHINNIH